MTPAMSRLTMIIWNVLPAPLRRRLRSSTGSRFVRFVPVAVAAFAATQTTIFVLVLAGVTAGTAALTGAVAGAGVSYVLSRWAWERKGRPSVLRETVPFWLVALAAWTVLSVAGHEGGVWASSMHATGFKRALIINGVTAAANCFTFMARFVIFHYVLFADRAAKGRHGSARQVSPGGRDSRGPLTPASGALTPASGATPAAPAVPRDVVADESGARA